MYTFFKSLPTENGSLCYHSEHTWRSVVRYIRGTMHVLQWTYREQYDSYIQHDFIWHNIIILRWIYTTSVGRSLPAQTNPTNNNNNYNNKSGEVRVYNAGLRGTVQSGGLVVVGVRTPRRHPVRYTIWLDDTDERSRANVFLIIFFFIIIYYFYCVNDSAVFDYTSGNVYDIISLRNWLLNSAARLLYMLRRPVIGCGGGTSAPSKYNNIMYNIPQVTVVGRNSVFRTWRCAPPVLLQSDGSGTSYTYIIYRRHHVYNTRSPSRIII